MEFQLWRNATVLLTVNTTSFLIDPMLGKKASFGVFPWTADTRLNPLVDLPFSPRQVIRYLKETDAVIITHLHPDHWDADAIALLDKNLPVICPAHIAATVTAYGFTNVRAIDSSLNFKGVQLWLTPGKHGTGEIGEKMGMVNGFVLSSGSESIYVAGDTIWCDDVRATIEKYRPQYIAVAGGAATFDTGDPVTMTTGHIGMLCTAFPEIHVLVTHLEAISTCTENRKCIRRKIAGRNFYDRCHIPEDGETLYLH